MMKQNAEYFVLNLIPLMIFETVWDPRIIQRYMIFLIYKNEKKINT